MRRVLSGQSNDKQVGWRIFEWIRLALRRAICTFCWRQRLWLLGQGRAVSHLELDDSERASIAQDASWRDLVLTGTLWRVRTMASSVLENRRLSDCLAAAKALPTSVGRGPGRSSAFITGGARPTRMTADAGAHSTNHDSRLFSATTYSDSCRPALPR
jgi:hypothetical protein